ncbi:MAG: Fe(2+)-dependent formamide hydrolase involved in riboflavin and F420 biosynthesis ArfB [Candidatus Methanohalarchaeum thermophilum]|uniref:Fe(2+)-dependent formamide hydrolase involved in riboflavin and F420 biosynthesis ArfB n=1 Tax=Methanohalarchaeum thermophilum TaxID=1903181 RepID=A0A1Q6DVJ1_METT1|nr:MAG: Fe(2+)-dependent formamide hydrolase involved in riboflavin and F420 biosynthesis ArfB [Candidatus Methanohalarchaeum thermophilum]
MTNNKVKIEEMTSKEIKQQINTGKDTVLILLGSIEQHGPHLPTSTDSQIAEILGKKVAKRINALMAPVIRPGCSDHHRKFKGTISLTYNTLIDIIDDYIDSLVRQGFKEIVIISTHGGNCAPIKTAISSFVKKYDKTKFIVLADLNKHLKIWWNAIKEYGIKEGDLNHAGAAETSILLSEKPSLVNKKEIKKGYTDNIEEEKLFTEDISYYSENGVLGDPTKAKKEIGQKLIEETANYFVKKIKEK